MGTESDTESGDGPQSLRERVDALEETIGALTAPDEVAVDGQGKQWTLADLLNIGLTRRQALLAISALGAGATLPFAIRTAIETVDAQEGGAVGQVGTDSERVNLFAESVDTETLTDGDDNTISNFVGDGLELDDETLEAVAESQFWMEEDVGTITPDGYSAIEVGSVATDEIDGDVVDRSEAIDHLEGNIYLTEEGESDPTQDDGDLWFEYEPDGSGDGGDPQ